MKILGSLLFICCAIGLVLTGFLYHIDRPPGYLFDEIYYAEAAKQLYNGSKDPNYQHPPLGKALISIPLYFGIAAPYSWRGMSLLFGLVGLGLVYCMARMMSLSRDWSMVSVLILAGSRSWITLSRLAMLDIFVAVSVLIAGMMLYKFLSSNDFSRDYEKYSLKLLLLVGVITGVGGAIKWNSFFTILWVVALYCFYFQGQLKRRILHFSLFLLVVLFSYLGSVGFFYGSVKALVNATGSQLLFHNSAMLPSNAYVGEQTFPSHGGLKGFVYNFFLNPRYVLKKEGYSPYSLSNNPVLLYSLVFFTLYLLYLLFLFIRNKKIEKLITDTDILFCYSYALFMILPWVLIPRIQYNYVYVTGFPFIALFITLSLKKYCSVSFRWGYLSIYWIFFIMEIVTFVSF